MSTLNWDNITNLEEGNIIYRVCSQKIAWRKVQGGNQQFCSFRSAIYNSNYSSYRLFTGGHNPDYGTPFYCAIWSDDDTDEAVLVNNDELVLIDKSVLMANVEGYGRRGTKNGEVLFEEETVNVPIVKKLLDKIFNDASIRKTFSIKTFENMFSGNKNTTELSDKYDDSIEKDLDEINHSSLTETEKANLVQTRLGHGKYRKELIDLWKSCSVTSIKDSRLLIASHIKPWKDSDNKERLDKYNGLLLNAGLDKLFDAGFITFGDDGLAEISEELDLNSRMNFGIFNADAELKLRFVEPQHKKYLMYHREYRFEHWLK